MDLYGAILNEDDGWKEKDVAVFILELPVAQVDLTLAGVAQDDGLCGEVIGANNADDFHIGRGRWGRVCAGQGGTRFEVGLKRDGWRGGLKVAVVPKEDGPRHAGGDERVQQQIGNESAAVHRF